MTKQECILQVLKEYGELTVSEITYILGSKYHMVSNRNRDVYTILYTRLLDKGLVERVPDTKPIKWRVKE